MNALAHGVAKFRTWAEQRRGPDYAGQRWHFDSEWECDYPDWQELYSATTEFLVSAAHRTLTEAELELVLYVLSRDNEDEHVLEILEQFPKIADAAVSYPDSQARWQAAVLAGRIGVAATVRRFLNDEAEYVRRRAGIALQDMESRA